MATAVVFTTFCEQPENFKLPPLLPMIFAAAASDVRKANSDGSYDYPALAENFRFFNQLKCLDLTVTSAVSAAMRGEETIALRVITKNPAALLKKEIVKNSVDVEYEVTALQAAIIANDIQLIERMKEHFASLTTDLEGNPVDGLAEMHRQMMEIYTESLTRHCQIQQEKIAALVAQQAAGNNIDPKTVRAAQENLKAYSDALASNELNTLVEAHHRAQAHNVFNFQPYIDAICNAPEAELDVVMELINADTEEKTQAAIAKGVSHFEIGFIKDGVSYTREEVQALPFSELTLLQKMNRLREKLSEHRRKEIISNSHYTIKSGELNDHIFGEESLGRVADPGYKKRSIIFSQVYGWAQVTEEEAVRQDLRQGIYYLIMKNPEPRCRPSNFKYLVDRSSHVGWGYKFASAGGVTSCRGRALPIFEDLCRAKTASFQNLLRSLCGHAPARLI